MVTILELFFWYSDANFQLWSHNCIFDIKYPRFLKMDIKNVQKWKLKKTFPEKFHSSILHMKGTF